MPSQYISKTVKSAIPTMSRRNFFRSAASITALVSFGNLLTSNRAMADASALPSAEDFGRLPALASLSLSPDGKHLAGLTSNDGKKAQITVWDTSDFSKPVGIGTDDRVPFMSVSFVKNNRLMVQTRQLFDYGSLKTFFFARTFTDLTGSKWFKGIPEERTNSKDEDIIRATSNADIVSYLPNDEESVLVAGDQGAIYKSNLVTGKIAMQERVGDKDFQLLYDNHGVLRAKSRVDYENGKMFFLQLIKNAETGIWEEHGRVYAKDREIPSTLAITKDPNIFLVATRRDGKDRTAIYNYNAKTRAFGDVAFEHPLFDASDARVDPRTGEVISFIFMADRPTEYFVNETFANTMSQIETALGVTKRTIDWLDMGTQKPYKLTITDGASVSLVDYSVDFKTIIVKKSGPSTPEQYFLYVEGKGLSALGDARPWINTALLGKGELKQYTARDGRPIPAFVYTPNEAKYGKGPFPTIIIPHGGPWARDYLDWNIITPWAQYFVARGYAVAMPQYRGSEGWGLSQWSAGDSKWGEEMSDDMDDVALGMVADGLSDRNRLAMHGYSFGGYSAMAAIVRPNPIYQCAISGAGPASPQTMKDETTDSRFGREFQAPFVGGLDALSVVKNASIPILIYHGDRDENVKPIESKKFHDALLAAGKNTKRILFKDMGHEGNKWTPEHATQLLTMCDDYLKTFRKGGL